MPTRIALEMVERTLGYYQNHQKADYDTNRLSILAIRPSDFNTLVEKGGTDEYW